MEPIVGVFRSRADAIAASTALRARGFPSDRVQLLLPGDEPYAESVVPTDESEQSGVGKAIGGVVGGVVGASAGLGLGAVIASLTVPGVGAVTAVGLAAAALFGAGGAAAGAAGGRELDEHSYHGLPKDELYLYEDALAHGRAVLFVTPESDGEAQTGRKVLEQAGVETLGAARESFWIGIRDAERIHYDASRREAPFEVVEGPYRRGYLAGLSGSASPHGTLKTTGEKEAYRCGLERGLARKKAGLSSRTH